MPVGSVRSCTDCSPLWWGSTSFRATREHGPQVLPRSGCCRGRRRWPTYGQDGTRRRKGAGFGARSPRALPRAVTSSRRLGTLSGRRGWCHNSSLLDGHYEWAPKKWNHLQNKSSSSSFAKSSRAFAERTLRRSVLSGDEKRPQKLLPGRGSTGSEWKESRIQLGTCFESVRAEPDSARSHRSSCVRSGETHGSNRLSGKP